MATRRPVIGGNWKMNTDRSSAVALAVKVYDELTGGTTPGVPTRTEAEVILFPPFPYLIAVDDALGKRPHRPAVGAQDVYFERDGAFTGEVSIPMLRDCGCTAVLVGHSERRHVIREPDEFIRKKLHAVLTNGLTGVLCIGETLEQREAGQTDAVNTAQLRSALEGVEASLASNLIIAYEPVWAIGTGRTATPDDAQKAHAQIRAVLGSLLGENLAQSTRIQYGGSVKGSNAAELLRMPDIDGALVGGASLKADEFAQIVRAAG